MKTTIQLGYSLHAWIRHGPSHRFYVTSDCCNQAQHSPSLLVLSFVIKCYSLVEPDLELLLTLTGEFFRLNLPSLPWSLGNANQGLSPSILPLYLGPSTWGKPQAHSTYLRVNPQVPDTSVSAIPQAPYKMTPSGPQALTTRSFSFILLFFPWYISIGIEGFYFMTSA